MKFPEPSAQERELQAAQLDELRAQRAATAEQLRLQELLAPYVYQATGIRPRYEQGRIVGFDEIPDPMKGKRAQIEEGLLNRSLAALGGTLPVDPALERNLGENRTVLRESLRKQLGPGFETSSIGQEALANEAKRGEELRMAARTGQLTLGEQLGMAREGARAQQEQRTLGQLIQAIQFPTAGAGYGLNVLNALQGGLAGYRQDRQGQFQADAYNAQHSGDTLRSIGQLAGFLGGSYLGGPGFAKLFGK